MEKENIIAKAIPIARSLKAVLAGLAIWTIFTACENCPSNPGGGFEPENNIFLTAIPINGTVPRIYRTDRSGNKMSEVAVNAMLYSAPSDNGKIAFIRNDPERKKNLLVISNADGSNQYEIDEDNSSYGVAFPIISPDGNKVAFFGGNQELYLWIHDPAKGSSYIDKISVKLYENTVPSFSPDGNKIAFIEGNKSTPGIKVRILDAGKPDLVIYERQHSPAFLKSGGGETGISWSATSLTICYGYSDGDTDDNTDFIIVKALSGSERPFEIKRRELGASSPVISPDEKFVAFTGRDGNIRAMSLISDSPVFSRLTRTDSTQINTCPRWSDDGKYLIYNNYFAMDKQNTFSTLCMIPLAIRGSIIEAEEMMIISNNCFRGFWKNTKGFGK